MPQDKKLTRQMINDALGKEISSKEFIAITDILGEPEIYTDIEEDTMNYSWYQHGIDIVVNYEAKTFYNIFLYPNGTTSEVEYIKDRKPCKPICEENSFDQNISMQEVRDKYGEPDAEGNHPKESALLYRNIHTYTIRFTFDDKSKLYEIVIGMRSN